MQDSLIKLLLGIDMLQLRLAKLLLQKLVLYEEAAEQMFEVGSPVNVPRLIMNQFCWLDHIVDSKKLCHEVLEMLAAMSTLEVRREVIACIPDMVEDDEHTMMSQKLSEILLVDSELTVPILDALSNLHLKPELLDEVRARVLGTMASVRLDDLAVVVRFILQGVACERPEKALTVVAELREQLDFETIFSTSVSSTPEKEMLAKDQAERGSEFLILDAIKSSVRFQKSVGDAWFKAIENVSTAANHKIIDLLVLLMLHATTTRGKAVEGLFRSKIRRGHFTELLLQSTFAAHASVVREYVHSVLAVAEVLLRSAEPLISYFACSMYTQAFLNFDAYCQQEIVSSLVTHIGSGYASEVDASLDILRDLVEKNLQRIVKFSMFVTGLLDYLDNLSLPQIRKLYWVLSALALRGPRESQAANDLLIVVRKQLSSGEHKYKRMGVMGALMVVGNLARSSSLDQTLSQTAPETHVPPDRMRMLQSLLATGARSCSSDAPASLSMYEDEGVTPGVTRGAVERMPRVTGDGGVTKTINGLPLSLELRYGIEEEPSQTEEDTPSIALNLLPLLCTGAGQTTSRGGSEKARQSLLCLCPQFRLLQICEKSVSGNLDMIDALLVCPLYLTSDNELEVDNFRMLSSEDKQLVCTALFYAANFFREVVRKSKVEKDVQASGSKQTKADDTQVVVDSSPDDSNPSAPDKQDDKPKVAGSVEMDQYRQYLREMDLDVLTLLKHRLVAGEGTDEDRRAHARKFAWRRPAELNFLVKDLVQKLDHVLLSSSSQHRVFLKTAKKFGFGHLDQLSASDVATATVGLLPALCSHVEFISAHFQDIIARNDGIVDGPGMDTTESKTMLEILNSIMHAFTAVINWNGFLRTENQTLLREALAVFSSRVDFTETTQRAPLQDLRRRSFSYFEALADSALDLQAAVTLTKLLTGFTRDNERGGMLSERSGMLSERLVTLARGFLCREWVGGNGQREHGARCNDNIRLLLLVYLEHTGDRLSAIEGITTEGVSELLEEESDGCSGRWPTLSRASFPVYYRIMMAEVVRNARRAATANEESVEEQLIQWSMSVRILHVLISFIKAFDSRPNLATALKYGRQFVEVFLRQAMPLLHRTFRSHTADVQTILKKLQLSTRFMQHMCSHSKVMKDVSLTNHVPPLKKCLETLIYRVKALLFYNKCTDAFWLGNLKNRDLQGEEILSQVSMTTEAETEDMDVTELASDDDSEVELEDVEAGKPNGKKRERQSDDDDSDSCSETY
ncbi:PREDICTED: Fanconi anemia group D2 protein homolog [Priapulus caudatus]|uniref:Fanconi anemia group D2 protein homolog n=1 Tax=Priapulus caudatus TaxID=37621 RepID=A0ABM1EBG3_PRICU|nr:PREDICTED: Fanconi anemia group D2 protein homolog [Priapulus caudatus]